MKLTLDTDILVAAFLARGACHELLERCERHHEIISSDFILNEFEAKLLRKFKVPPGKVAEAAQLVRSCSVRVDPVALGEAVCRDSDDDWVLATAVEGRCVCIVTGDKDLLPVGNYAGVRILSPRSFWKFEAGQIGRS